MTHDPAGSQPPDARKAANEENTLYAPEIGKTPQKRRKATKNGQS